MGRLAGRSARVVVMGQGYVGLMVAMEAVEAGFEVLGFEIDPDKVERLRAGDSHIEDVTDERLTAALRGGYHPSSDPEDLAGFDVAVISVPTPLRESLPDLRYIESAATQLAPHVTTSSLVVLESTTYPGTTEELVGRVIADKSPGHLIFGQDYLLGYSPERIDPGNQHFTLQTTPKIVAGVDTPSLEAVDAFFRAFVDTTVRVSSPKEAELAKIIENTFRHVNIALVNEVAMFAHDLDINAWEAIDAAATKPFGFMKFTPGPGVGGHCLPIDPSYLSWRVRSHLGESFRFIELANDINAHMPQYVVQRITRSLNSEHKSVAGARIAVLGVAYKSGVGDPREAPALTIIEQLLELGADVVAFDPYVADGVVDTRASLRSDLDADLLRICDLVVIVTDHECFDYDMLIAHSRRVLDTRNRLKGRNSDTVEGL